MIRPATPADAPQLVVLMHKLAVFEGYADRCTVTASDLIERGFSAERPAEFWAWVAEEESELQGYAIACCIPFTFDLRPTIVLKELFVEQHARGKHHGSRLFSAVLGFGRTINARLLRWQVLPGNNAAASFYKKLGSARDMTWESWVLNIDDF